MTEQEYASLYNQLCDMHAFLGSGRARGWIRDDIRARLLRAAKDLRDELYEVKRAEDRRASMPDGARSSACSECGWTYGTHSPKCRHGAPKVCEACE